MSIHKTAGTKFYISPTTMVPDTVNVMTDVNAIAFFAALADWIEVGEVENYGEVGDVASPINFTAVGNRRVRKLKGPRDAGVQNLVVGRDPLDDGQEQMLVAELTDFNYPFRIVMADQPSASYGPSILYYGGLVMSRPTNLGDVMAVTRRTFNIGINTGLYEVAGPALAVPVNLIRPTISGTAVQTGVVLTAQEGTWSGSPTSYTYQWQHDVSGNGAFINVAALGTSRTFTPVVGDVGDSLRVQVTAINAAGASAPASSLGTIIQIA